MLCTTHVFSQTNIEKAPPGRAWSYRRCAEPASKSLHIDTVSAGTFDSLVHRIYNHLQHTGDTLSATEDSVYLLLVNTIEWRDFDEEPEVVKRYPLLGELDKIFEERYLIQMYKKYRPCRGRGFSPNFANFKIQVGGTWFDCSRYYVLE